MLFPIWNLQKNRQGVLINMTTEFNLSEKFLSLIAEKIRKVKEKGCENIYSIIFINDAYKKFMEAIYENIKYTTEKMTTLFGIKVFVFDKYSRFNYGDDDILITIKDLDKLAGDNLSNG